MEQRQLRLGDIVDDYCPRERRVTNHAVVAMIEDDVRQTRCNTCQAEHPFKGGRAPRKRKKDAPGALYQEVLAGMPEADAPAALAAPPPPPAVATPAAGAAAARADTLAAAPDTAAGTAETPLPSAPAVEDGPVHRQLIRATLPRLEGHKEVRQIPDFTVRQPTGRPPGNFRGGDPRAKPRGTGQGQGQGQPSNRPATGGRFAGARAGNQGFGGATRRTAGDFHASQPQSRDGGGGGGRKRSR